MYLITYLQCHAITNNRRNYTIWASGMQCTIPRAHNSFDVELTLPDHKSVINFKVLKNDGMRPTVDTIHIRKLQRHLSKLLYSRIRPGHLCTKILLILSISSSETGKRWRYESSDTDLPQVGPTGRTQCSPIKCGPQYSCMLSMETTVPAGTSGSQLLVQLRPVDAIVFFFF